MAVENPSTLGGLNPLWPLGTDQKAEGDDHIRLIKRLLKQTFPSTAAADLAFGVKITPDRWVWNDKADFTGADVAVMSETGRLGLVSAALPANTRSALTIGGDIHMTSGYSLLWNAYFDTVAAGFKAGAAGWGAAISTNPANGQISLLRSSASVAAGAAMTLNNVIQLDPTNGAIFVDINFTYGIGSGTISHQNRAPFVDEYKVAGSGQFRWWKSSTGLISGAGLTNLATLDDVGNFTTGGSVNASSGQFISPGTSAVLAATGAGQIVLRPGGVGVTTGQAIIATNGQMTLSGLLQFVDYLQSTTATAVIGTTGAGTIFQRPNGIGSTTGQAFVAGNGDYTISGSVATKATAGQWVAPSDIRLKNVHGDYTHGLAELMQIQPVIYSMKADPAESLIVGLIAQDIETVLPETVRKVAGEIDGQAVDDLRQFDPTALQYALINAVKELSARIAVLEGAT